MYLIFKKILIYNYSYLISIIIYTVNVFYIVLYDFEFTLGIIQNDSPPFLHLATQATGCDLAHSGQ